LTVKSDSDYSIKCVTLWHKTWEKNGWKTSKGEDVVNSDIIKDILQILSHRTNELSKTSFQHVYAHKGDIGNEGADKLALSASMRLERQVMGNMIYFYSHTHGEYKSFSQLYLCAFTMMYSDKEIEYNCAEQHHHQQKALLFGDTEIASKIMLASSPGVQKKLGRQVKNFDNAIWLSKCYDICKRCNIAKFSQHPQLLEILMSTKGK
jgi:ribA/ribD-fused uncharacterized protein